MSRQPRRFAVVGAALLLSCWLVVGCSTYDSGILHAGPTGDAGPGAGHDVDGSTGPQAGAGGGGSRDAAANGGDGGPDASGAADASQTSPGCVPNPDPVDEVCPQVCPEVCDAKDNDCDRRIDEGDSLCPAAHASATCSMGTCVVVDCLDDYRDCNGVASDGCEIAPDDPNNCGLCKQVCTLSNAAATCVAGECKVKSCNPGYGDCDGDATSCETELNTLKDCGGCASTGDNTACLSLPNATTQCSEGSCAVDKCIGNFGDCDGDGKSCETELNVQSHCGSCSQTCALPGTAATCDTGSCLATACNVGFDECEGGPGNGCEPLDTLRDCGACGKRCGPDPDSSVDNHVALADCNNQVCTITECDPGYANCDSDPFNGCETDTRTEQNCGGCGVSCDSSDFPSSDVSCASGTCTFVACKDGFGDCTGGTQDGCETKLDVPSHCGSCTNACNPGQFCTGGSCSDLDCSVAPHAGDCGGVKCADCDTDGVDCELDVGSDVDNCQACGNKCAFTAGTTPVGTLLCTASGCAVACPADHADCDGDHRNGCEKSLTTLANCGSCGMGCTIANATATCATGACRVLQCATDYADCNGDGLSCETSLAAASTCGSCGNACSAPNALSTCGGTPGARVCAVGACSQSYFEDCNALQPDGCEVDSRSDGGNCGSCGNDCAAQPQVATASCVNSACVIGTCDPGWGDCTPIAGCETRVDTTARCGSCNNDCNAVLANTTATSCDPTSLICKVGTCATGFANCDGADANGCETSLYTVNDCGGCSSKGMNTVCTGLPNVATSACGGGTCTISACNPGFLDCDQQAANGCERDGALLGPCTPDTNCTKQLFGANEYFFCQNDSTWAAARNKCRLQLGGDLVAIGSSAENAFVQTNLAASANAWLGASDADLEGLFEWASDGVPFWRNGASVLGGYANWNTGEPNAAAAAEDCAEIYAGGTSVGKWNDAACSVAKDFVCEVAADACPGDPNKWLVGQCGCGAADLDADADGFAACNDGCDSDVNKLAEGVCGCGVSEASCGPGGDCAFKSYAGMSSTGYYVCSTARSWDDARSVCQSIPGADLVHIDDVTEDNFVKASISAQSWIGATDSAVEAQWRWSNDDSLFWSGSGSGSAQGGRYAHWSTTASQPEGGANADCAMWWWSNGGGWADEPCGSAYSFVCEAPADACPSSPKLAPGQCGCGLADSDSDLDGVADCNDECPDDAELTLAGDCGCPSAAAADGTLCNDGACAANTQCAAGRCGTIAQCFAENAGISVGHYHACARSAAGKAYCWGNNGSGRLGDGTTIERRGPVEVSGLSDVREIASGESHTCAIVGSGELYCWGNGALSRLGTGASTDQYAPTKISGITSAVQLAVGNGHSCVVLSNGSVQCWGAGGSGRLGDGATADNATPGPVSNLTDAVQVAAGSDFTCARRSGGSVVCWGNGASGRLGNNATTDQLVPVAVQGLTNVVQIAAGTAHACAVVSGGQAYCWGYGANGRLGNNAISDQPVPVAVTGLSNAVQIEAGDNFTCAVRSDQSAACWGYNGNGRLGTGNTTQVLVPAAVSGSYAWSRISAGLNSACGVDTDGSVRCFGYGIYGINGDGTSADRQVPSLVSPAFHDAQAVTAGYFHGCGIDAGGVLRCFGDDRYSQLGDGATADRWTPTPSAPLTNVTQASAGEWQTCALTNVGDVYCWGVNTNGRLGLGDTTTRSTPTKVALGAAATQVSTGFDTSCAVLVGGSIKCWGLDDNGQLGDGGLNANWYVPVPVANITNAVEVRAGYRHTCARLADGTIQCWGWNAYGQLGDNTVVARGVPTPVMGVSGATALAVGAYHSCALVSGGQVKCWGENDQGQLGDGTVIDRHVATTVTGLLDAVEIASFYKHVCAVRANGSLACWGYNANGRLGSGSTTNSLVPTTVVGLRDVEHVGVGYHHSCATLRSGGMFCWGYGVVGQLGHGNTQDRLLAAPVQGLPSP